MTTFDLKKSLQRIADDERVDFHARGTCEIAITEIERLRARITDLEEQTLRALGERAAITAGERGNEHQNPPPPADHGSVVRKTL